MASSASRATTATSCGSSRSATDSALYRGTVWIDRRTFARIRVQAVQGGLSAPVVSNEETHRYTPAATIDNQPIFLFAGLSARQIVLIAGRNLLVEKDVSFSNFRVNDVEFERDREAARASERIMFRETDSGLRYYVKEGDTRVISDTQTSQVKAMAMGTYIDPSYAFPLPIFGINYLNFSLAGSNNTQLALLFGGVLAAGNIQRPKVGSTNLDASIDFFAIAVPSSDRVYGPGGEVESERVLTWPLSTGLNLGWQATPFQKVTMQYQLRFDGYIRDTTTAETFQPPSSTLTNGIGGAWEYRRGGYNVTINGTWYARSRLGGMGGRAAGWPGPRQRRRPTHVHEVQRRRGEERLSGSVPEVLRERRMVRRPGSRSVRAVSVRDVRRHAHPRRAGIRRSLRRTGDGPRIRIRSTSSSVYRLDLFLEHAWGRAGGSDTVWQPLPGIGAAVNLRAPWNTILRAEVGQSWLPDRYQGLGSTTLQILLLKPLG